MRRIHAFALCLGLLWGLAGGVLADTVVVVTGDVNGGYSETIDVTTAELVRLGVKRDEVVRERAADFASAAAKRTDVRVYLTFGVEALREVLKANVREPVVAALIPRAAYERTVRDAGKRGAAPMAALYLDQPLGRQLDLLRLALPEARRIGVILGPESIAQQAALSAAMRARGLEPVVGMATTAEALFAGIKPALDETDALLAVPDSLVFNNNTVSGVLTAAYRARIPMLAFSPAYVKAGALLSVHSTPAHIGVQAAAMVRGVYSGGGSVVSQYPVDYTVRVNDSVARSLGLALREDVLLEQLRRQERRP
jgi:ABC-type uncharacterized transport system substrate-binding protein